MAQWISLMDYAVKYGVSLSTLRRHIKANKIPYKIENGRYLLREDASTAAMAATLPSPVTVAAPAPAGSRTQPYRSDSAALLAKPSPNFEVEQLKAELRKAREEIAELKMLVALYEDQIHHAPSPAIHRPYREV